MLTCGAVEFLLEGFAQVAVLQLGGDGDAFVEHLPVERSTHGISCLGLVAEVIMIDHVNHRAHNRLTVLCNTI